jgi:hypothetical protein
VRREDRAERDPDPAEIIQAAAGRNPYALDFAYQRHEARLRVLDA